MSIRVSCATWESSWRVMLAVSPEKNRHEKRDDCSEADPPREFHGRKPVWPDVGDFPKRSRNRVRQIADDRDDDEAGDHGENVSEIVAARFRQHAGEKNAENGAVGVTVNSDHDWNDAHVWQQNYKI